MEQRDWIGLSNASKGRRFSNKVTRAFNVLTDSTSAQVGESGSGGATQAGQPKAASTRWITVSRTFMRANRFDSAATRVQGDSTVSVFCTISSIASSYA